MTQRDRWGTALGLFVALGVGCSPPSHHPDAGPVDSGPPDAGIPDAGWPLPLSDFGTQYIDAWCSYAARCIVGDVFDTPTCVAEQGALANGYNGTGTMIGLIDAGSVTYDPIRARGCVDDLTNMDCSATFERITDIPSCAAALIGQVPDSLRCTADVACVPTDICFFSGAFDSEQLCGGFCGRKMNRCDTDADCATGQICNAQNVCEIPPNPPGGLGFACGTEDSCQPGLGCFLESADGGTLVCDTYTPLTPGGPVACDIDQRCPSQAGVALLCMQGGCYPPPPPVAEGKACSLSLANCQSGLACVPNDTEQTGVCVTPRQRGDSCSNVFECGGPISASWCDEGQGTCVARPAAGSACTPSPTSLCDITTSWCDTSRAPATCAAYLSPGSACTVDGQCGPPWSGNTCSTVDGGTACVAPPQPSCGP